MSSCSLSSRSCSSSSSDEIARDDSPSEPPLPRLSGRGGGAAWEAHRRGGEGREGEVGGAGVRAGATRLKIPSKPNCEWKTKTASNAPQQQHQSWHQGGAAGDYLNIKIFGVSGELSLILNVATVRHFKASNSIARKMYKYSQI